MKIIDYLVYKYSKYIIAVFLIGMFFLMSLSVKDEIATPKELKNIFSGYTVLKTKESNFNWETPILTKLTSSISLDFFVEPKLEKKIFDWEKNVDSGTLYSINYNKAGQDFLYKDNNPGEILGSSRLILIILIVLSGLLIYKVGFYIGRKKNKFTGRLVGLTSVFFFAFSSNITAYGRFVGEYVLGGVFLLLVFYSFVKFLEEKNHKNFYFFFFSLVLSFLTTYLSYFLIPIFIIYLLIYVFLQIKNKCNVKEKIVKICKAGAISCGTIIGLFVMIYFVYLPFTYKTDSIVIKKINEEEIKNDFIRGREDSYLKPFLIYYGGLKKFYNDKGDINTYFLGNVFEKKEWYMYPILLLVKLPLATVLLLIIIKIHIFKDFIKNISEKGNKLVFNNSFKKKILNYYKNSKIEIFGGAFVFLWFLYLMFCKNEFSFLYIIPILPWLYIILSKRLIRILTIVPDQVKKAKKFYNKKAFFIGGISILIYGFLAVNLYAYPYYLSFMSLGVGGIDNAYSIAVKDNSDSGQDLKRLAKWLDKSNVEKIKLDYYGSAEDYEAVYLDREKYEVWNKEDGIPSGWFAVSATNYQESKFDQHDNYYFLDEYEPQEKIGNTILIYYLPENLEIK